MTISITACADRTIASVTFGLHMGGTSADQTVALADIAEFAANNRTLSVQRIQWLEGGQTWAKSYRATEHHKTLAQGTICRICAGPDGDCTVWERN